MLLLDTLLSLHISRLIIVILSGLLRLGRLLGT